MSPNFPVLCVTHNTPNLLRRLYPESNGRLETHNNGLVPSSAASIKLLLRFARNSGSVGLDNRFSQRFNCDEDSIADDATDCDAHPYLAGILKFGRQFYDQLR